MFIGYFPDFAHGGALAIQMHRHNCLGLWGNGGLELGDIDAAGFLVAVDQHHFAASDPAGFGCGKKGVGVGDDFVASLEAKGHHSEPERVCTVCHANSVLCASVFGKLRLELLEHWASHILAAHEYFLYIGVDLAFDVGVLPYMSVE